MRLALALLLMLLLVTAPALAGRTIVVMSSGLSPCATTLNASNTQDEVRQLGTYRTLGMDFDVITPQNAKTLWLKSGDFPGRAGLGGANSVHYIASVVQEFGSVTGAQPLGCPCIPCSLTVLGNWPGAGPLVLFTATALYNFDHLSETGSAPACSTGFRSNAVGFSTKYEINRFVPGSSYGWRGYNLASGFRYTASTPPAAGVWRPLVRESRNGWSPYASQSPSIAPADMDSMPPTAQTSDTIAAVARYRRNGAGPPIVIAAMGQMGFARRDFGTELTALAFADSATGGAMLGQTSPLPVRFLIQIGPLAASSKYNSASSGGLDAGLGPYPGDSAYVKATLSSFHAMGLKGTVLLQTNADSVAAYANQYEWVRLLWPEAHVVPFDMAGVFVWNSVSPNIVQGNATAARPYDVFGVTRARVLFPSGCASPPACDCSTDTTSVFCALKRQFAFLEKYFGRERVDHVIACPLEDFTPAYFTKVLGSMDSLRTCLYLAGVRGVRVGNISQLNDVGTPTGSTNPRGYASNLSIDPVHDLATGNTIGTIAFLPSRDWDFVPNIINTFPHELPSEFLNGLFNGDWYTESRSAQYSQGHNFFVRTVIFEVPGNALGGDGTALGDWRPGYWHARTLWAICQAANRFGRKIIEPSYGDETVTWVQRSGVR